MSLVLSVIRVSRVHLGFGEMPEVLDDRGNMETLDLPVVLETKENQEMMDYQ